MIVVSTLGSDILFARFPTVELMVSQRKLSMAITSRSTVIQKGCLLKLLWIISGGIITARTYSRDYYDLFYMNPVLPLGGYRDNILTVWQAAPKSWSECTTSDKVGKVN